MANLIQLKMLEDLSGFLLVDKPEGIAFATVMKTVKRKFNLVKVGHGGSLDTMASGLMVLLIGDANKFAERVMGADRVYEGRLRFGGTTDTGDIHGRPLAAAGASLLPADVDGFFAPFRGDVFQTEPRFAAIRREGAAEYEVVDTGEHSQFLSHVYRIRGRSDGASEISFSVSCTRSFLPRAMAVESATTLTALRRTAIGKFSVANAVPFARILETEMRDFAALVMPLSEALQ